ncbi:sulfurtransferase [Rhodococcus pyridinivorans]|uniref:sulfurtransferase n=1 Tax=Rhodococcus pyridinivorans TaxID=103816 RepID=UPI00207862FC|nr:sulfurtransferase [Rhodococcus pyridinivorans]USI92957.1 sulfurtransferase [Rhodococcus pyridinivorans]
MQQLVNSAWLEARLGREDLCVLHCSITHVTDENGKPDYDSGRSAWAEGHIPGSQHVDLVHELSDKDSDIPLMMPSLDQLRDVLEGVGVADGRQIVLYDNNFSMWAARVWWMLRAVSVEAAVLDGGWRTWIQEGRPVETGEQQPAPIDTLTLTPKPEYFVTKDQVLDQLGSASTCLIDALHPKVFHGERQDYKRPGHIPGARNVPALHLVDRESHQYLPLNDLRQRFEATSASNADRVITYCGGGVAASSAAFALGLLGIFNVAVYDGSLNEWAADPTLPMTTTDGTREQVKCEL